MGLKPDFQILADNKNITGIIAERLVELRIDDDAGFQSDSATIVLDDHHGEIEVPKTGVELTIDLGYENELQRMGIFTVDEVEISSPPYRLSISARAAKMKQSLKAPKDRSFHDISLGDLIKKISAEHDYGVSISESLAEIQLKQVDQQSESDLNLMTRLAKESGATFKLTVNKLVFIERSKSKSVSGQNVADISIADDQVQSYRLMTADRNKYTRVIAKYRDLESAKEVQVSEGTGDPAFTIRRVYPDASSAVAAARAKFESLQRGTGSLSLSIIGDALIRAERIIELTELRNKINERWLCRQVSHSITPNGFITNITAETPHG
ncbi:phage late control D family protein [Piscirickettsia litoralis]|uniref:Phage tail protein n=1 Tax=Piscirickettsia litoralis TaxID=1891921 RepID=A0ABX2ZZU3_9GAMM|nr:contractile injection system protein, VgrG/Pvc8 family [Piscirickettsia litoralis]ODN41542.1 hypothetical protein BGC07_15655 [Piscirickettsia litoralis]